VTFNLHYLDKYIEVLRFIRVKHDVRGSIGGLGPSNNIDRKQSRTKLRNFGQASTRTKRSKEAGTGIHRYFRWKVDSHKNWT
jgi:hypothetical protein